MKVKKFKDAIPKEIFVKGAKYNVVFTNTMNFTDTVYGLFDPSTRTIFIKKHMTERQTIATFFHELCHAFEHEFEKELGHKAINWLEYALADFYMSNPVWRV